MLGFYEEEQKVFGHSLNENEGTMTYERRRQGNLKKKGEKLLLLRSRSCLVVL